MEIPNLWRDNPSDIAYVEGYRKGLEKGYRKGREDAQKEIKCIIGHYEFMENLISRKLKSTICPCVGCKRTESDYCGLRACCDDFRKWKEAEDGIHSEGEA